jgi:chromosome partitioning protein
MIILIGGEKGGTGKSTIATTLAAMRAARGREVLLVDADPQGSATAWAAERAGTTAASLTCVSKTGPSFRKDVLDLAGRYEDVVIDVGGRDSKELRAAMVVADRMYLPLQPSYADVWTLDAMEQLVDQAVAYGPLEAYVVISRAYADPRIPENRDAIALLDDFQLLRWSGVVLCERVDYRRAFGAGLCVEELDGAGKAAAEVRTLYEHAYQEVGAHG